MGTRSEAGSARSVQVTDHGDASWKLGYPDPVPASVGPGAREAESGPEDGSPAMVSNEIRSALRVHRKNVPPHLRFDPYHKLLTLTWWQLVLVFAAIFVGANLAFATLYYLIPGSIQNARAGSFEDALAFSVQTISTIGYGALTPATTYANVLVATEALFGLLTFAFLAGILFNKFALPSARVIFSDKAVVTTQHKRPALVFRLANARDNQIVDAQVRLTLIRTEVTPEGYEMRVPYDLKLDRDRSALLLTAWMIVHRIDAESPLAGQTAEQLEKADAILVATFMGIDGTFSQLIHACQFYGPSNLVWRAEFVETEGRERGGWREVDYAALHQVRQV